MGWLQELAGPAPLKGQVVVTSQNGGSTTYVNVKTAEEACSGLQGKLRFFRGAFFEAGAEPAKAKEAPPSPAPLKVSSTDDDGSSSRRRRKDS